MQNGKTIYGIIVVFWRVWKSKFKMAAGGHIENII